MNAVITEKRKNEQLKVYPLQSVIQDNLSLREENKMEEQKRINSFIEKHKKLLLKLAK